MGTPKEIAPGIFHWTAVHPEIGIRVHSYYWSLGRVLLDPLLPAPEGMAWLKKHGPPEHIILTNRLHSRHSAKLVAAFRCTVWEPERTPPPRPSAEGTALRSRRHAA